MQQDILNIFYAKSILDKTEDIVQNICSSMSDIDYGQCRKFRIRLETTIEIHERVFFMDLSTALFNELKVWLKNNAFNNENEVMKITIYKEGSVSYQTKRV